MVLGETYLIKNWGNFYKKYKILGGFHKILIFFSFLIFLFKAYNILFSINMRDELRNQSNDYWSLTKFAV